MLGQRVEKTSSLEHIPLTLFLCGDVMTRRGIDCVVLVNNQVLGWGCARLEATLRTLESSEIATAGAAFN